MLNAVRSMSLSIAVNDKSFCSNNQRIEKLIKVVFLRHGQSTWNLENRFTGWTDVNLSTQGECEARRAGLMLKDSGYQFDLAYTSLLKRAIKTLWVVQDTLDMLWLPVEKDWRLNERHYGALQGLNKDEIKEHYGAEQVQQWRRGYQSLPPELNHSDPRHPRFDMRYNHLNANILPATESLENTLVRAKSYWDNDITPKIIEGKKLLIVAHHNTLRAIIMQIENLGEQEIMELNIPTGAPLIYEFSENLEVVTKYYLSECDSPEHFTQQLESLGAVM